MALDNQLSFDFNDGGPILEIPAPLMKQHFRVHWHVARHSLTDFKRTSVEWILRAVNDGPRYQCRTGHKIITIGAQRRPLPPDPVDAALACSFLLRSDLVLRLCVAMWRRGGKTRLLFRELYDRLYMGESLLAHRLRSLAEGGRCWHLDLVEYCRDVYRWFRYEEKENGTGEWIFEARAASILGHDLVRPRQFYKRPVRFFLFDPVHMRAEQDLTIIWEDDDNVACLDFPINFVDPFPRGKVYERRGRYVYGLERDEDCVIAVRLRRCGKILYHKKLAMISIVRTQEDPPPTTCLRGRTACTFSSC